MEMRLPDAALALRLSYQQVLRLALKGELSARRDATGKWWVSAADVERRRAEPVTS